MIKKKVAKKLFKLSDAQVEKLRLMLQEDKFSLKIDPNPYLDALLISHSLEKGLSLDSPRVSFGEDKALFLLKHLRNINESCFEYDVSMSILEEYLNSRQEDTDKIKKIRVEFETLKDQMPFQRVPAGVDSIAHSNLVNKKEKDYINFLKSRHDIRKTTKETISESTIKEAIRIASFAPSACNRQPWKIYYSMDQKRNEELGAIVSGNKSFAKDMKYYCAVVLDHKFFANRPDEFRQIYLNAGIFLAYFVLALHYLDIGSCILQFTGLVDDAAETSHKLLKLNDTEQVMAVVGFGRYPKIVKYGRAARRSADEIAARF